MYNINLKWYVAFKNWIKKTLRKYLVRHIVVALDISYNLREIHAYSKVVKITCHAGVRRCLQNMLRVVVTDVHYTLRVSDHHRGAYLTRNKLLFNLSHRSVANKLLVVITRTR